MSRQDPSTRATRPPRRCLRCDTSLANVTSLGRGTGVTLKLFSDPKHWMTTVKRPSGENGVTLAGTTSLVPKAPGTAGVSPRPPQRSRPPTRGGERGSRAPGPAPAQSGPWLPPASGDRGGGDGSPKAWPPRACTRPPPCLSCNATRDVTLHSKGEKSGRCQQEHR